MDVTVAATNKTPVSSVRGAGYPQAAFAMERMLDRVARELHLDRAEVRRRNLIPAAKMPYQKPLKTRGGTFVQYDSGDYPACQEQLLAAAGWDDFPRRQAEARAQGRYTGIGLAHGLKGTGRGPFETGLVRIAPTGRSRCSLALPRSVRACAPRSRKSAPANLACARRISMWSRRHIRRVARARRVRQPPDRYRRLVRAALGACRGRQGQKLASHILEAAEHDLELADGEVRVVGAPQLAVKLGELSRILRGAPGYAFPPGVEPGLEANQQFRIDDLAYANSCHVAEVEVDIETGAVRILRYHALQDSGTLIIR